MVFVSAHQPWFRWQTTPHAILQPIQQTRPYPCHPVGWSVKRTQRLPQGQVRREGRRIGRRPPRTPHRRFRHPLHRLRKVPRPRHRKCTCKWCDVSNTLFIKTARNLPFLPFFLFFFAYLIYFSS